MRFHIDNAPALHRRGSDARSPEGMLVYKFKMPLLMTIFFAQHIIAAGFVTAASDQVICFEQMYVTCSCTEKY